jgi:organic hydroperoxide reductase OsmC/OhrA
LPAAPQQPEPTHRSGKPAAPPPHPIAYVTLNRCQTPHISTFPTAGLPVSIAILPRVHPYPHVYSVAGHAEAVGHVQTTADGLPMLLVASPIEFDGPGNLWSPETMLCAAVADCLVLTFRAVSRQSKLDWASIDCRVEGVLERTGGISRFTHFTSNVTLVIAPTVDAALARRVVEKSEQSCLVANSLNALREVRLQIRTAATGAVRATALPPARSTDQRH